MAVDEDSKEVTPPPGLIAGMDEEGETIEVTVDSGAMGTVGPMSAGAGFETYETEASRNGKKTSERMNSRKRMKCSSW